MKKTIVYTNNGAIKVVRGAKTLVACMIPILGIVVLYFVKDQGARLGVIAAFTAIFSVTLSAFTPAAMKDIFSATSAYVSLRYSTKLEKSSILILNTLFNQIFCRPSRLRWWNILMRNDCTHRYLHRRKATKIDFGFLTHCMIFYLKCLDNDLLRFILSGIVVLVVM